MTFSHSFPRGFDARQAVRCSSSKRAPKIGVSCCSTKRNKGQPPSRKPLPNRPIGAWRRPHPPLGGELARPMGESGLRVGTGRHHPQNGCEIARALGSPFEINGRINWSGGWQPLTRVLFQSSHPGIEQRARRWWRRYQAFWTRHIRSSPRRRPPERRRASTR